MKSGKASCRRSVADLVHSIRYSEGQARWWFDMRHSALTYDECRQRFLRHRKDIKAFHRMLTRSAERLSRQYSDTKDKVTK